MPQPASCNLSIDQTYVHPGDKTTTFSMMLADDESGTVWALSTVSDVMLHDLGP